jgi:hypothetical protein
MLPSRVWRSDRHGYSMATTMNSTILCESLLYRQSCDAETAAKSVRSVGVISWAAPPDICYLDRNGCDRPDSSGTRVSISMIQEQ